MIHPSSFPRYLAFLVALFVAGGCANTTNLVTGENVRGAYSWQQEVQLGQEADQQIVAQYGVYDHEQLGRYVEEVGQAVLQTSAYTDPATPSEIRNTPFTFRVLDTETVNAFALPGGFVYVTRGLLAHLENEAQLAVVLGHEIGHVLGRHSSQQAADAQLGQLGLIGAAVLGQTVLGGSAGETILNAGGTGVQLLMLKYGRDAEREADQAGVAYAEFAGYDASEGAAFFETLDRLQDQSGGGLPSFLSTHPDPGEREQTIVQLAAQYDTGTAVNAESFLRRLDGVVLGMNPRQGFTEGSTFYHPDLRFRFSYPQGWRVTNQAAAVTVAQPDNQAQLQLALAQESSARAAARAFAERQGITVQDSRAVTVNGLPAYGVVARAQAQQQTLGVVAYFIEHGGGVYSMLGLTPSQAFSQYQGVLEQAMRSFSRLTDSRYLTREPVRIDLVETSRSGTFASLVEGRRLPQDFDLEKMAILNQTTSQAVIPSGRLLKLTRR